MTLYRVLETEAMDTLDEVLDYDAMDHSEVNRAFVDDLLASATIGQDVLDLGTGTARIPILLCECHPDVRVMAVDLAPTMLDVARNNVELASLTERIMLDLVDAKCLPFEEGRFDLVMSNSLIHHIADPRGLLAEAVRVVAPGGLVFIRDLLRPNDDDEVRRLVETYAGGECEHARQMFDDSLRAALNLSEIRALVRELGADPASVQQTTDRHWTWKYYA
jgi:ubiquinone/menaquinone biosynthesis C-methylase UbiE